MKIKCMAKYPGNYEYVPTGVLKLEIDTDSFRMEGQKAWTDGKTKSIESRIHEIICQIIIAAAWKKEYAAYHKKREEERRIEQERQAEKDRLDRPERERVSQLEIGYKRWMYHKELPEYVDAVKFYYLEHQGEPEGDFAKWLKWVEGYLEKNNPLNGEYPKYALSGEKPFKNPRILSASPGFMGPVRTCPPILDLLSRIFGPTRSLAFGLLPHFRT